jgi:hypothetical protein
VTGRGERDVEVRHALETEVHVLAAEVEVPQLRSALSSKSAVALADELELLLIQAADAAEELAMLPLRGRRWVS